MWKIKSAYYHIYPTYWGTLPYHTGPKIWTSLLNYIFNINGQVVDSLDADQKPCVLQRLIWIYTVCSGQSDPTRGYYSKYKRDSASYLLGPTLQW